MTSFPEALDSTMLASFKRCPQLYKREYLEHWKSKFPSVDLHAGKAFAEGLEKTRRAFWEDGRPPGEAIAAGLSALESLYGDFDSGDSAKSKERMLGALEFYFKNYPLGEDPAVPADLGGGKRAIEFSFALPLPINHPTSGKPILYCGRQDAVVEFAGGLYGMDEKTTTSLGPGWGKKWDLKSQFMGYSWANQQAGLETQGTVVRGVSILKTKYETQQALVPHPRWLIDRWLEQTVKLIQRMIESWKESDWAYTFDDACVAYKGGCKFSRVCGSPNPEEWLPMQFEKRVWNPLIREEEKNV